MTICKFYQSGRCRYGNNCKFEHIDPPGAVGGSGGSGGGGGGGSRGARSGGAFGNSTNDPFAPSAPHKPRQQSNKITDDHPQWPLSAIGMKDDCTRGNELTGDCSPEELRAMAYASAPRGMSAEITQRESQFVAEHRAKVDALSRGGMQTHAPNNNRTQPGDPFSKSMPNGNNSNFASFAQQQPVANGMAQEPMNSDFGQPMQQNAAPFGQQQQQPVSQPANPFAGNNSFGQATSATMTQDPSSPPLTAAQEQQFSASQFGFARVPETAPPPRFY